MSNFKFIYEDELGITHFDKYFNYIKNSRQHMPENLWRFASDTSRYELNGRLTLHDSRLESLAISNTYNADDNIVAVDCVSINLLLASSGKIELSYSGVLSVRYHKPLGEWEDKAADLLTHEFTIVRAGVYRHLIEFDHGVEFEIFFRNFDAQPNAECTS